MGAATLVFDSHSILSQTKTRKSLHSARVAVAIDDNSFSHVKLNQAPGDTYTISSPGRFVEITSNKNLEIDVTQNGTTITFEINRKFFIDCSMDSVVIRNPSSDTDSASITALWS